MSENKYDPSEMIDDYDAVGGDSQTLNRGFLRSTANSRTFLNEDSNIHVRSEYTKDDYYYFRRSEKLENDPKRIIDVCAKAYDNVGIIKNTVDLMSDFSCKGIRIVHQNKKTQAFLRQWFKFVCGRDVCQKIMKGLYRDGNVIIERLDGDIKNKTVERWKTQGFADIPVVSKRIPRKYIVHNLQSIEKIGDTIVTERPVFLFRPNLNVLNDVQFYTKTKNIDLKLNYDGVGQNDWIEMDQSRIYDYYYKKDDCEKWAKPMAYAIMNELMMLDKIELADMSALDGVISNVRLWQLGSFEHNIYPSREALQKLRNILAKNVGGGVLDLVWGPELNFKESNTQVHHFLGKEKYEAILTLIYAGLGIPPTLTGSSTASGMTNNFISIKTLVERLQYGRDILVDFWEKQLDLVVRAMGVQGTPRVLFTYNVLSDEAAEKALLIDMVDRDLISGESVRDAFGFDPDIEQTKVTRESRKRGKSVPYKASPYHQPMIMEDLKKAYVNSGAYPPSQFGVQVDEKFDVAPMEIKQINEPKPKLTNPDGGRPKNANDKVPRKQKRVSPAKGFINRMLWFSKAQERVDDIINPIFLASLGKANARFLTKQEVLEIERIKFEALSHINYAQEFTDEDIINVLDKKGTDAAIANYHLAYADFVANSDGANKLTSEQIRQIYIVALAME